MNRFAIPFTLFTVLASSQLAGCASTNGAADPTARPPSCQKNECDIAYDRCKATHVAPPDNCKACNDECNNVSYDQIVSCLETCQSICSRASAPDTACEDQSTGCQKTAENAICTDGLDPKDVPGDITMTFTWKPPATPHAGVCTDSGIATFINVCQSSGSQSACDAFVKGHAACTSCVVSRSDADTWGALVVFSASANQAQTVTNDVGCVAAIEGDATESGCGAKLFARDVCLSRCSAATDASTCIDFASAHDCKAEVVAAAACVQKLGIAEAGSPYEVCRVDQGDNNSIISLARFFCGH